MQEKGERNLRHTETQPRNHVKTEAEFQVILNKPRSYRKLQKPEEARKASPLRTPGQ